ncbi:response regulator [Nitrospirota bacterium]
MKILIVEDESIQAMNTMRQLVSMGHEVTGVIKSGDMAFIKIEEKLPDLVLMDIKLHGPLTGIDITRIINEKYDIPVIYVTAYAYDDTLEQIKNTQYSGIISKPFDPYQLKEAIEKWGTIH